MAFLNSSQIQGLQDTFKNHFEQFSSGSDNYISVVKSPIKIINNPSEEVLPGYGPENMNVQDITYQPVTGVFPAIIIYPKTLQSNQFGQLKFNLDENQIMIKVREDAKNYLITDKTERILIDGQYYNNELTFSVQSYFGLKYFYFKLTSTK